MAFSNPGGRSIPACIRWPDNSIYPNLKNPGFRCAASRLRLLSRTQNQANRPHDASHAGRPHPRRPEERSDVRALPLWVASAAPAGRQDKVATAAARPRNDAGVWGDGETVAECVKNPGFRCAASTLRILRRTQANHPHDACHAGSPHPVALRSAAT